MRQAMGRPPPVPPEDLLGLFAKHCAAALADVLLKVM